MDAQALESILAAGEGAHVEFKRCGATPESDTFQTICAFANRAGGSVFLGILDAGTVQGINPENALPIERNVANVTHNPKLFNPPVDVECERITYDGRLVLRLWVPVSSEVHTYKGVVYDRMADVDVQVRSRDRMAMLYLRKQSIFSERRILHAVRRSDLRSDLLQRVRVMAAGKRANHPWTTMPDEDLLRASQLISRDVDTGEEGYNLAAVLLLGQDEVIAAACPSYRTDALVRREDTSRYDDREIVSTNLIESYDILVEFMRKHLPDRFFMDGSRTVSPRDIIARELVSNTLAHREYQGAFLARLEIGDFGVETRNASRAASDVPLTPASFNPVPKNPIIARFFNHIGYAEELGSGTRNLFTYANAYFGSNPILLDGDVFVARLEDARNAGKAQVAGSIDMVVNRLIDKNGFVTANDLAAAAGIAVRTARARLSQMAATGVIRAEGSTKGRRYTRIRS